MPPAKDIKPGLRFPVITPNGTAEVRLLKFGYGQGASKRATTWDGISKKEVLLHWPCSIIFKCNQFAGRFSLVSPMDNNHWAVRIEVIIDDEDFWKDMQTPSSDPLPGVSPEYKPDSTDTYFFS
ncbi:MAG TPA: hypothetical protein VGN23_12190 [Verrucomicrobiae bacterium]|jgi:hypothetical protein